MKIKKQRLEAFSDGVIAIIITIMVLFHKDLAEMLSWDFWGLLESIFSALL